MFNLADGMNVSEGVRFFGLSAAPNGDEGDVCEEQTEEEANLDADLLEDASTNRNPTWQHNSRRALVLWRSGLTCATASAGPEATGPYTLARSGSEIAATAVCLAPAAAPSSTAGTPNLLQLPLMLLLLLVIIIIIIIMSSNVRSTPVI